jgi:ankyrin repeat protein
MSLVATVLNEIRIKNEKLDKNEHRLSEYGALDFFVQQSKSNPLLTSEMKAQAIRSAGKTLKMPVINYDGNITVSNVRSCSVQDAENTSALVGVTFATYAVGFTVVPAMYSNNEIDKQNDITKKYLKCARVLGAALDGAALTALDAAKTQVFADKLIYTEALGGDVIDVPWASREDILSDIEPMMNANDYYGRVHIIGNNGVRSLLNKLAEKGTYNIVDKSLEWAGKEFHFTNRLANEDGKYATFYAVEDGNVDILFRYDREAVLGTTTKVGHEWDIVTMPYIGIPVGVHYYESVGDQSAIAGDATADLTCAKKEYYGFSVDVAFVTAYNSAIATKANPIIAVEIAKGDTYANPVVVVNSESNPVNTKEVASE